MEKKNNREAAFKQIAAYYAEIIEEILDHAYYRCSYGDQGSQEEAYYRKAAFEIYSLLKERYEHAHAHCPLQELIEVDKEFEHTYRY
jgi:hypothetical protein